MDADVATEASTYTKASILQQASAALLAQANQSPSIALTLI
jgi:flagellin